MRGCIISARVGPLAAIKQASLPNICKKKYEQGVDRHDH